MSYAKAMKHSKSHRKDRFYQQCGFSMSDSVRSLAAIAEDTAKSYHVRDMRTEEILSPDFADADDAVDFIRNNYPDRWCGIYTDKGFCLME